MRQLVLACEILTVYCYTVFINIFTQTYYTRTFISDNSLKNYTDLILRESHINEMNFQKLISTGAHKETPNNGLFF